MIMHLIASSYLHISSQSNDPIWLCIWLQESSSYITTHSHFLSYYYHRVGLVILKKTRMITNNIAYNHYKKSKICYLDHNEIFQKRAIITFLKFDLRWARYELESMLSEESWHAIQITQHNPGYSFAKTT